MTNLSTYINIDGNQGNFANIGGDGSKLSNLNASNITGAVPTASVASTAYSVDGANVSGPVSLATTAYSVSAANVSGTVATATTAGTVTTGAQPNITSVGTLSTLDVTGNINANNITSANIITATAFIGNGSQLTGMYSNTNVQSYLPTYSGSLGGVLTTGAQPNITSVGATFSAGNVTVNALTVSTSASITGNLTVGGNVNFTSGNINQISGNAGQFFGDAQGFGALYAGVPSGYADIGNTVLQLTASVNNYAQLNFQNINGGSGASADFVLTADIGNDVAYFADFGIASSTHADPAFPVLQPTDTYLYSVGSDQAGPADGSANLVIAATNGYIKLMSGGPEIDNIIATVKDTNFYINANTAAANTTSGALQVVGGAGIQGALYASSINAPTLTGSLTTAAQPNITSLGTITSLTATAISANTLTTSGNTSIGGNLYVAGNISAAGNINIISGNSGVFYGNVATGFDALYAGVPAGFTLLPQEITQFSSNFDGYAQVSSHNINPGASSTSDFVATANNGNDDTFFIDMGIAGSGYNGLTAVNALGTSLDPNDGYLYTQGNANGGFGNLVIGSNEVNGALKIIAGGGNVANIAAIVTAPGTATTMNVVGGVTATSFTGNGAALTSVTGANVTGTVANATYATSAGSATTAGTVTTGAQPNITSVGTLGSLNVTGNVSAAFFTGNGSALTGITSSYGNANVSAYLGNSSTTGNIYANEVTAKQIALPYSNTNAYSANVLVLNGNTLYKSNSAIAANIPFAIGNTANTWSMAKQWVAPAQAFWVDPNNGLDTNDGSQSQPVKTIARGQQLLSNVFGTLFLLPGTYTEDVTWTKPNTTIVGPGGGDMVNATGDWTFVHTSSSVRVQGIGFYTLTHSGAGALYLFQCSAANNNPFTIATGAGYFQANECNLADGPINVNTATTGNVSGVGLYDTNFTELNVNGNSVVTLQSAYGESANINVNYGTFVAYNSSILTPTAGNVVLTSAANTNIIISNTTFADPDGTSATINVGGDYSLQGVVVDYANSTFSGTDFGEPTYYDNITVINYLKAQAIYETRVVPRANGVTSGSTITINADLVDQYDIAALAVPATIAAPTGTLTDGQKLTIRIRDNTIAQALTWNSVFRAIGVTLPTTTVAGKLVYVGCIYNILDAKWDVVSVAQEA